MKLTKLKSWEILFSNASCSECSFIRIVTVQPPRALVLNKEMVKANSIQY